MNNFFFFRHFVQVEIHVTYFDLDKVNIIFFKYILPYVYMSVYLPMFFYVA